MISKSNLFLAALLAASVAAVAPASANAMFDLSNMKFVGGATSNGSFIGGGAASGTLFSFFPGDFPCCYTIGTTAGTLPAASYVYAASQPTRFTTGLPAGVGEVIQIGASGTYIPYLQFAFQNPLSDGDTFDTNPLVYAYTFECNAFGQASYSPCGGTSRFFATASTAVPEPSSISLIGLGLLALGGLLFARRRKSSAAI